MIVLILLISRDVHILRFQSDCGFVFVKFGRSNDCYLGNTWCTPKDTAREFMRIQILYLSAVSSDLLTHWSRRGARRRQNTQNAWILQFIHVSCLGILLLRVFIRIYLTRCIAKYINMLTKCKTTEKPTILHNICLINYLSSHRFLGFACAWTKILIA